MYEMLAGKLPFTGETEASTWKSVVHLDPPPLPQHISPDVKKLVTIMLTKSPDRRPSVDQLVLTKLVTRYVKLLVGYGRLAKNQYEVIKGPVGEEEAESKHSMPRTKRAEVGQMKERTKTRERQREEVKGAVEGKGAGKAEERQGASKGSKEEVKAEKKEGGKESIPAAAKKEAEIPK